MNIEIQKQKEDENGWVFLVTVDHMKHSVSLDKEYLEKIASGVEPEELVKKSFEFLLARESKESILRQFNLKEINKYFPEYEKEIVK